MFFWDINYSPFSVEEFDLMNKKGTTFRNLEKSCAKVVEEDVHKLCRY
jgi:hypothetical protein